MFVTVTCLVSDTWNVPTSKDEEKMRVISEDLLIVTEMNEEVVSDGKILTITDADAGFWLTKKCCLVKQKILYIISRYLIRDD